MQFRRIIRGNTVKTSMAVLAVFSVSFFHFVFNAYCSERTVRITGENDFHNTFKLGRKEKLKVVYEEWLCEGLWEEGSSSLNIKDALEKAHKSLKAVESKINELITEQGKSVTSYSIDDFIDEAIGDYSYGLMAVLKDLKGTTDKSQEVIKKQTIGAITHTLDPPPATKKQSGPWCVSGWSHQESGGCIYSESLNSIKKSFSSSAKNIKNLLADIEKDRRGMLRDNAFMKVVRIAHNPATVLGKKMSRFQKVSKELSKVKGEIERTKLIKNIQTIAGKGSQMQLEKEGANSSKVNYIALLEKQAKRLQKKKKTFEESARQQFKKVLLQRHITPVGGEFEMINALDARLYELNFSKRVGKFLEGILPQFKDIDKKVEKIINKLAPANLVSLESWGYRKYKCEDKNKTRQEKTMQIHIEGKGAAIKVPAESK